MPFSHHSHSGQFCSHAKDQLEDVVKEAIGQGMEVFCMTEHMPRELDDELYPEEVAEGITPAKLVDIFEAYVVEARRLQEKYADKLSILVGMETDWFRCDGAHPTIERLFSRHRFDMFVGSVHHVHSVPIDFSKEMYLQAVEVSRSKAGASAAADGEELLAEDYFDLHLSMLESLKPPVVGHFDLIRLLGDFEKKGRSIKDWPVVWQKAVRNLEYIKGYGGCLEINSAGLRKGLRHPYPCQDVCKEFLQMGGRFVLSDDSHGMAQIGHSYKGVLDFLDAVGIDKVSVFEKLPESGNARFDAAPTREVAVDGIRHSAFIKRLN